MPFRCNSLRRARRLDKTIEDKMKRDGQTVTDILERDGAEETEMNNSTFHLGRKRRQLGFHPARYVRLRLFFLRVYAIFSGGGEENFLQTRS